MIIRVGRGVTTLSTLEDGRPVAVQQGNLLATAFHPELTGDSRFHRFFLDLASGGNSAELGMTTGSRINDVLRCMLMNAPGGTNLATPAETVHRARPLRRASLWRDSLANRDDRIVLTDWDGFKLRGLAAARALNGGGAWRIDRLHLAGPDPTLPLAGEKVRWAAGLDLLEAVAQAAGQRGAERVFLRTPEGSPVADLAQRDRILSLLPGDPSARLAGT